MQFISNNYYFLAVDGKRYIVSTFVSEMGAVCIVDGDVQTSYRPICRCFGSFRAVNLGAEKKIYS